MSNLDKLYAWLTQVGFLTLRQAVDSGDHAWINAELEMLHNIPSLIGEQNAARHRYYWTQERVRYLDQLASIKNELAESRMRTFYEPIWREMEPLLAESVDLTASR